MNEIPRPEHPNPQWQRANWRNLNGEWEFDFDFGNSGEARGLPAAQRLPLRIQVPFCPESALSGVGFTDFMPAVWYRRTLEISEAELQGRVLLHFGAVDYTATLWVNGTQAGRHEGGYTSFAFEVSSLLRAGENVLVLRAQDDTRDPLICSGKQSERYASFSCLYTRTTGIWQTVWAEFLPRTHIAEAKFRPDPENGCLHLYAKVEGAETFRAVARWQGREVGCASAKSSGNAVRLTLPLHESHLWEVGAGGLYDLELTYGEDSVKSYFGLRSLQLDGYRFLINGKSVFQRLILDQGFYPDGVYTAPSDAALERDILLSQAAGFNGARLHEKVFEARFLYHADRLGYLCWGEFPNWGGDAADPRLLHKFLPQWSEAVARDSNHPAIVGWCPYNETWDGQFNSNLRLIYETTKRLDPDRPCIDTSGYVHTATDIFCVHDYEQNPAQFAQNYAGFAEGGDAFHDSKRGCGYSGQAMFVSEYGGIGWDIEGGWGYGAAPVSEEEFKARYKGLTDALLDHPKMFAFCYTQLTDVEQERNGVYTYDRKAKFDPAFFKKVNERKAAIEE
ncbi:MAG: beta-galactosidase [Oscillospiraceae bacterium]|nr:beta-galactosidase [Oscillospiraceae bacterium]